MDNPKNPSKMLSGHASTQDTVPAAEWVEVSKLTPWADNPRVNKHAVWPVANSIREFGWLTPLVARAEDGLIIAGHTRLAAAEVLGMDVVPVRFVEGLDDRHAALAALADNRLAEKADWDFPKLADTLGHYSLSEAELAGWDDVDLASLADNVPDFGPLEPGEEKPPRTCPHCGGEV